MPARSLATAAVVMSLAILLLLLAAAALPMQCVVSHSSHHSSSSTPLIHRIHLAYRLQFLQQALPGRSLATAVGIVSCKVNIFGSGSGINSAMPRSPSCSSSSLPLPRLPHSLGLPASIDCYFFTIPCCVTTREKSNSRVNVKLKKKLTLLENYECLG
jgi:hypothetical protein